MIRKPAISLAAVAGRRKLLLDVGAKLEEDGFSAVFSPSMGDGMGFLEALALRTSRIQLGTGIANIYARNPIEYAQTASAIHELSDGRFVFGVGVSHAPVNQRLGVQAGKPLADMRDFVERYRQAGEQGAGPLPPIVVASLRKKMVALAGEIADGCIWANGARSHMAESLSVLSAEKRDPFFAGDILPCCVDEDIDAAAATIRKSLLGYVALPNYRNYWIEAGYEEEMRAIEAAIDAGQNERLPSLMSDRWLNDVAVFGPAGRVRDAVEAWYAAGVGTVILAPFSTSGGQLKAIGEIVAAFG